MAELNPLLEKALRKDPKKAAGEEKARHSAEVERFLKSRAAQAAVGGGGFNMGILDLLSAMPAAQAAKLLKTGNLGGAAVNALAFTSQFDDSKLGQDVSDILAFMPVHGFGSTRGIARAQSRLRDKAAQGVKAELPLFNLAEGKMAPGRLKQFEKGMRNYIENASGAKDPTKQLAELDEWLKTFNRTKPIDKRALGDRMPASLRPALYNTAVEQGYGRLKLPPRSKAPMDKYGNRVTKGDAIQQLEAAGKPTSGGRMNATQVAPEGIRSFEEVLEAGQRGQMPDKWKKAFLDRQKRELGPDAKKYMDMQGPDWYQQAGQQWAGGALLGGGISAAQSLAGGGQEQKGGDQKAGLVVNKRNIGRLSQNYEKTLSKLNLQSPSTAEMNKIEAAYAAKYPKLYARGTQSFPLGKPKEGPQFSNNGYFRPDVFQTVVRSAPDVSPNWKSRAYRGEVSNRLGHEMMHAVDFSRIPSGLRGLSPKTKIGFEDFAIRGNKMTLPEDRRAQFLDIPSSQRKTVSDAAYGMKVGKTGKYLSGGDISWEKYQKQPIEQRAFKAGETAEDSLSRFFQMMAENKEGIALGGAGLLGGNLIAGQTNDDNHQKAGLIVNKRNIGRLRQMQEEQLTRLGKVRPNTPELNELEAVFAAKYPKLYESATEGGQFDVGRGMGGGSFEPSTGQVRVDIPGRPESWEAHPKVVGEVLDSLGHESLHANDFKRIGKINDPNTGERINIGDFIYPGNLRNKEYSNDIVDRIYELYPNADLSKVKPSYITPRDAQGMHHDQDVAMSIYKNQPVEARAFKAGATSRKSTGKLLEMLAEPAEKPMSIQKSAFDRFMELQDTKPGAKPDLNSPKYRDLLGLLKENAPEIIGGVGAGLAGGMAASGKKEDDQAVVGRLTKLRRKIAMANNPAAFLDKPLDGIATSKPYSDRYFYERAQNTDMMLPEEGNRRGGAYVRATGQGVDPMQGNDSLGNKYFQYLIEHPTTTLEGGRNKIAGFVEPKNSLKVPTDTFFGGAKSLDQVIPKFHKKGQTPSASRYGREGVNAYLPKSVRLNNTDLRRIGRSIPDSHGRTYPGVTGDALGDYILNKYAKHYGYDSVIPRRSALGTDDKDLVSKFRGTKPRPTHEMIIPNESRWDKKPAAVANLASIKTALDTDFNSLKGKQKSVEPVKTSKSKTSYEAPEKDYIKELLGVDVGLSVGGVKPQVPDWYIKEAHSKYDKLVNEMGGPINSYAERKKFVDDYLKKYDPEIPF